MSRQLKKTQTFPELPGHFWKCPISANPCKTYTTWSTQKEVRGTYFTLFDFDVTLLVRGTPRLFFGYRTPIVKKGEGNIG